MIRKILRSLLSFVGLELFAASAFAGWEKFTLTVLNRRASGCEVIARLHTR